VSTISLINRPCHFSIQLSRSRHKLQSLSDIGRLISRHYSNAPFSRRCTHALKECPIPSFKRSLLNGWLLLLLWPGQFGCVVGSFSVVDIARWNVQHNQSCAVVADHWPLTTVWTLALMECGMPPRHQSHMRSCRPLFLQWDIDRQTDRQREGGQGRREGGTDGRRREERGSEGGRERGKEAGRGKEGGREGGRVFVDAASIREIYEHEGEEGEPDAWSDIGNVAWSPVTPWVYSVRSHLVIVKLSEWFLDASGLRNRDFSNPRPIVPWTFRGVYRLGLQV